MELLTVLPEGKVEEGEEEKLLLMEAEALPGGRSFHRTLLLLMIERRARWSSRRGARPVARAF